MKIDDKMIGKISRLAYLGFREGEKGKIREDLEQILSFVEKLQELDTENVEPLIHVSDRVNATRGDEPGETLDREEALRNAPMKSKEFFLVPKMIRKKR